MNKYCGPDCTWLVPKEGTVTMIVLTYSATKKVFDPTLWAKLRTDQNMDTFINNNLLEYIKSQMVDILIVNGRNAPNSCVALKHFLCQFQSCASITASPPMFNSEKSINRCPPLVETDKDIFKKGNPTPKKDNLCNEEPIDEDFLADHGTSSDLRRSPLQQNACSDENDDQDGEPFVWTEERVQEANKAASRQIGANCPPSDQNSRDQGPLENDLKEAANQEKESTEEQGKIYYPTTEEWNTPAWDDKVWCIKNQADL